jgi:hypothetical protein
MNVQTANQIKKSLDIPTQPLAIALIFMDIVPEAPVSWADENRFQTPYSS